MLSALPSSSRLSAGGQVPGFGAADCLAPCVLPGAVHRHAHCPHEPATGTLAASAHFAGPGVASGSREPRKASSWTLPPLPILLAQHPPVPGAAPSSCHGPEIPSRRLDRDLDVCPHLFGGLGVPSLGLACKGVGSSELFPEKQLPALSREDGSVLALTVPPATRVVCPPCTLLVVDLPAEWTQVYMGTSLAMGTRYWGHGR